MFPLPELFWFATVLKFCGWSCYKYIFLKKTFSVKQVLLYTYLTLQNHWLKLIQINEGNEIIPKWIILKAKKEISYLFSLFFLRRYSEKTSTIIVSNLHKFFWVLSGIVDFFVTILMKLLNTNPQFSLQLCLFLYIGLINYADRSYVVPL